ncbi:hypothetical protein LCGC14_1921720 [marine sediment metagenome]|uniref:Uncharacterized protein n=1 Tax=marine sediment metagenome TaxID=412755 RepID=A0A0F9FRA8_9ZZZZ
MVGGVNVSSETKETVDKIMDHLEGCFHEMWIAEDTEKLREWLLDTLDSMIRSLNDT